MVAEVERLSADLIERARRHHVPVVDVSPGLDAAMAEAAGRLGLSLPTADDGVERNRA